MRREQQGLDGRLVEPLRVVDHHEQRRILGRSGEEVERRRPGREPVEVDARAETECGSQRVGSRLRERVQVPQRRPHQLEQPGEGDLALGRDAAGPEDLHSRGALACELQQGGLAGTGFAADHQESAGSEAGGVEQLHDPGALVTPSM